MVVTITGLWRFFYDDTYEEEWKQINWTILDGNVMNMYLIINVGKYGAIDSYDSTFHGYYIIKNSASPYNLQADLIMDGQVISYGEMVCKGTCLFNIYQFSLLCITQQ